MVDALALAFPGRRWRHALMAVALCALLPLHGAAEERSFFDRVLGIFTGNDKERPAPGPDDIVYKLEIDAGETDSDLKAAIDDASNLKALADTLPSNAAALIRRAAEDRDRIATALYAFGYYAARVDITAAGVPVDASSAIAAVDRARKPGPVPVKIAVAVGPQFRFGRVRFEDADTRSPAQAPLAGEALGVESGQPARSTAILAAELRLAAAMRKEGHPFAAVTGRDVVADHAGGTVDVTFRLKRGPKAAFGELGVEGTERMNPAFIRERRSFRPGEPYDPEKLAAMRKELGRYDVFDSIDIAEGERLDPQGRLPITVQVKERLRRFVGFGVKYSTTDGAEINGYWGHRNLFGGAERLRLDASITSFSTSPGDFTDLENLGYKVTAAFAKPGIITIADDLLAQVTGLREKTDAYRRQGVLLAASIRRKISDRLSLQIGLDFEFAKVRDVFGDNDYKLIGFPIELAYDSTDNPLDPSRGIRINALAAPFPSFGGATVGMVTLKGSLSAYIALDRRARWVLAGRVASGSILGAAISALPAHRRFYVGGGGSLRGYDYQSVSPRNDAGQLIGGRSFVEGSLELRVKITDTIGVVTFFDAGSAFAARYPDFREPLRYAVGIGARYYTSIGPIRADIAFPLNRRSGDSAFGLYISLGQAF